jgi:transposase
MDIYRKRRRLIIYRNIQRVQNELSDKNIALSEIWKSLDSLNRSAKHMSRGSIIREIDRITGEWKRFFFIRIGKEGDERRVRWRYHAAYLEDAKRKDGKYPLLCTDDSIDPIEAVRLYFFKDFVEKSFRTIKGDILIEPVRHRLDQRIRAYLFVCVLAYWLRSHMSYLHGTEGVEDPHRSLEVLLRDLENVQKVDVTLGNEVRTWHLNLLGRALETLKKLGNVNLFREENKIINM